MKPLRSTLLAVAVALTPLAAAQTLADVMLTTAIASTLYPGVRLPSGSLRAVGAGTAPVIARVPDAAAWTDWEVYTATGIVAALEPALMNNLETGLFLDGFERVETTPTNDGATVTTRVVFAHADGRRALLVTFRQPRELIWLVARSR